MPDDTGLVPDDQVEALRQLGAWIQRCWSPEAAIASTSGSGSTLTLTVPAGVVVDRLVLREDQTNGQAVAAYNVQVRGGQGRGGGEGVGRHPAAVAAAEDVPHTTATAPPPMTRRTRTRTPWESPRCCRRGLSTNAHAPRPPPRHW
jgi:hypothetical protein